MTSLADVLFMLHGDLRRPDRRCAGRNRSVEASVIAGGQRVDATVEIAGACGNEARSASPVIEASPRQIGVRRHVVAFKEDGPRDRRA
jgi:hypothetical protein